MDNADNAIPPDMLAAIGNPTARTILTDAEIGWQMKIKARKLIDDGEIKDEKTLRQYSATRIKWITGLTYISEDTRAYWLKFEQSFVRSARKYLAELREAESMNTK